MSRVRRIVGADDVRRRDTRRRGSARPRLPRPCIRARRARTCAARRTLENASGPRVGMKMEERRTREPDEPERGRGLLEREERVAPACAASDGRSAERETIRAWSRTDACGGTRRARPSPARRPPVPCSGSRGRRQSRGRTGAARRRAALRETSAGGRSTAALRGVEVDQDWTPGIEVRTHTGPLRQRVFLLCRVFSDRRYDDCGWLGTYLSLVRSTFIGSWCMEGRGTWGPSARCSSAPYIREGGGELGD